MLMAAADPLDTHLQPGSSGKRRPLHSPGCLLTVELLDDHRVNIKTLAFLGPE